MVGKCSPQAIARVPYVTWQTGVPGRYTASILRWTPAQVHRNAQPTKSRYSCLNKLQGVAQNSTEHFLPARVSPALPQNDDGRARAICTWAGFCSSCLFPRGYLPALLAVLRVLRVRVALTPRHLPPRPGVCRCLPFVTASGNPLRFTPGGHSTKVNKQPSRYQTKQTSLAMYMTKDRKRLRLLLKDLPSHRRTPAFRTLRTRIVAASQRT